MTVVCITLVVRCENFTCFHYQVKYYPKVFLLTDKHLYTLQQIDVLYHHVGTQTGPVNKRYIYLVNRLVTSKLYQYRMSLINNIVDIVLLFRRAYAATIHQCHG